LSLFDTSKIGSRRKEERGYTYVRLTDEGVGVRARSYSSLKVGIWVMNEIELRSIFPTFSRLRFWRKTTMTTRSWRAIMIAARASVATSTSVVKDESLDEAALEACSEHL
jgi:hypothetical protein